MNKRTLAALAVTAAVLSAPALAQGKGVTYDCDTAPGHFSELRLPGAATFTASGKVRLMTLAHDRKWAPLVRISVSNDPEVIGPSDEAWAGFTMMNLPQFEKKIPALLETSERPKGGENKEDSIGPASDTDVPFDFAFDGKQVHMTVDGHAQTFALTAERPVLMITCSTGEFLVHDLTITPGA